MPSEETARVEVGEAAAPDELALALRAMPPRTPAADAAHACAGGDPFSCHQLGVHFHRGEGGAARDDERAIAVWRHACDRGWLHSCALVGPLIELRAPGQGTPMLRRACDAGSALACSNLALWFEEHGPPQRAQALFDRACDLGEASGCFRSGRMREACERGDDHACQVLR